LGEILLCAAEAIAGAVLVANEPRGSNQIKHSEEGRELMEHVLPIADSRGGR
jgi:hypothetical protein